jgi:hypothetical protein
MHIRIIIADGPGGTNFLPFKVVKADKDDETILHRDRYGIYE